MDIVALIRDGAKRQAKLGGNSKSKKRKLLACNDQEKNQEKQEFVKAFNSSNRSMVPNSIEEMTSCFDPYRGLLMRKLGGANARIWNNLSNLYVNTPIRYDVGPQTFIDAYEPSLIRLKSFNNSQKVLYGTTLGEHRIVDYSDLMSYAAHHEEEDPYEVKDEITDVDIRNDDQLFLLNGFDGTKIYDANKNNINLGLLGSDYSKSVIFNPYHQFTILRGSQTGEIDIYDTRVKMGNSNETNKLLTKKIPDKRLLPVSNIEMVNDHQFISSSKSSSKLLLWDLRYNSRDMVVSLGFSAQLSHDPVKDRGVTSVKHDPISNFIYATSFDNSIKVFSLGSTNETEPLLNIKLNHEINPHIIGTNSKLKIMRNRIGGHNLVFNSDKELHSLNLPKSLNGLQFLKHKLLTDPGVLSSMGTGLNKDCLVNDFDFNAVGNFLVVGGTKVTTQELAVLNLKD